MPCAPGEEGHMTVEESSRTDRGLSQLLLNHRIRMFSSVFNDNNRRHRTSDLVYVINHVFVPVNEPGPEGRLSSDGGPLLGHTVLAAAYAYCEYIDDSHKPQWYHIVQMLSDLCDFPYYCCPPEKILSQLRGMKPGGTVSGSL